MGEFNKVHLSLHWLKLWYQLENRGILVHMIIETLPHIEVKFLFSVWFGVAMSNLLMIDQIPLPASHFTMGLSLMPYHMACGYQGKTDSNS